MFQYLLIISTRCSTYKTHKEIVHFFKITILHPSTVPIANVKLKRSRKCIMCLTKNSLEKTICTNDNVQNILWEKYVHSSIMFIWQRIIESIANANAFLSCTFTDLYDSIKEDTFTQAYIFRVSDSGQPVTYARQYFTNNPRHKLYLCMTARSTRVYTSLLHTAIIHTKTFFVPACHPGKKVLSKRNYHILHCYNHTRFTRHIPLLNKI